ncbi:hypothetical protein GGI13_000111 [Coemansia sp. RSA 455]|nr:hypothetical protein GGI13_000111 [Coemansia sp. RSA 455]
MHFKFRHMSDPQECVRAAIPIEPPNARQQEAMKLRRDSHLTPLKVPYNCDIENRMEYLNFDQALLPVKADDEGSGDCP